MLKRDEPSLNEDVSLMLQHVNPQTQYKTALVIHYYNSSVAITIELFTFKEVIEVLKRAAPPDSPMKAQLFHLRSISELKSALTNLSLCTFRGS